MIELVVGLSLAASQPQPPQPQTASVNPHAADLFERDPELRAWAVRLFDANRDGWLTLYEAQPAVARLKEIADADGDGRVSVREFAEARKSLALQNAGATTVVVVR
jgi:hypothetical protein